MNRHKLSLPTRSFAALLALAAVAGQSGPAGAESTKKLLSVEFTPRHVVKIEAGDFHFRNGQPAPVHSHAAPAIGYIAKGAILYQVEGHEPQLLRQGDAFYEPAGQRILRFDNASASDEAIFVDFNLQQEGEPFIIFEKPPTEAIDRRALPTATLDGSTIDAAEAYAHRLLPGGSETLGRRTPVLGYVAEGEVEMRSEGKMPLRFKAGESFFQPAGGTAATLANASSQATAKVITFNLRKP